MEIMRKNQITVVFLIIIISLLAYVAIGKFVVRNKIEDYLYNTKNYSKKEISSIIVHHSFLSILLSYKEWTIDVKFADEPESNYYYAFDKGEIITYGVSCNVDKKQLKHYDFDDFVIIDETKTCNQALELLYEDEDYQYYFGCVQSETVFVELNNKEKYTLKEAVNSGFLSIKQIENYLKEKSNQAIHKIKK